MARYINENDLLVKIMDLNLDHVQGDDGRELCQVIQDLPVADVREVVLCKDCKYITEHYDTDGNAPYWTCSEWDSGTDYDGFCHYAERRGGE